MKGLRSRVVFLLMVFVLAVTPFSAVSYGEEELTRDEKILALGTPPDSLSRMDDFNKNYIANLYDETQGKARYAGKVDSIGTMSSSDIEINAYESDDGSDSSYKYVKITMTGNAYGSIGTNIYGKALGLGLAWSDNWSYDSSETVAHWKHKNFWGSVIDEYEWGIIDAYTPKVGITFKYEDLHSNSYSLAMNGWVRLKISKTSTGTTDFSAKFGYTEESVAWSATISYPPSITFSPSTKIYQRSFPGNFKY